MFKRLSRKSAQSTLEYAILIGVITAALIAMQVYIKRGYEGKLKEGADSMGWQFDPTGATINSTINTTSHTNEDLTKEGVTTTQIIEQKTNRDEIVNITAFGNLF